MKNLLSKRIAVAAGREAADLVLKNARIINVFTASVQEGDVAIQDGYIAGIGHYEGTEEIDLQGAYLSPGLIDGHVHLESAMVHPAEFAKAVLPRGTTTIIADPHEIANVSGIKGIQFLLEASKNLPMTVKMMLPSCVPATNFENAGAVLSAEDLAPLYQDAAVLGLGEVMDYPGVIQGREDILDKLVGAQDKVIDGHGPEIHHRDLNAYVAAGIKTEHECSTEKEMEERLQKGMYILIREGSAARNLTTLSKVVNRDNSRRCLFCTDDKHPEDLLQRGHIDNNLRMAVQAGIDPITAIQMASLNAAECYHLRHLGAIAPGYQADLVVFEDLHDFRATKVFQKGCLVASEGRLQTPIPSAPASHLHHTVNLPPVDQKDFQLPISSDTLQVIQLQPHSLVTEKKLRKVKKVDGFFEQDHRLDLLKIAVIERHRRTGNMGLGLVEGFGLKNGAIATTISHDSHNLIVIGDNDPDMALATETLRKVGGGITLCHQGKVLQTLALPIAGLISEEPIDQVHQQLEEMIHLAHDSLSVSRSVDPFMTLSFLALPVIPEIKLTDMGLFDVSQFQFIPLEATD
ncbi:Adenine deaminase [Tindallia magadiensis]|uniref:Adenine deaminase n=1 Tax=Tindallia magadiensis TaxID=69895 RepID=A0A1I3EUJ8_9FIRM|nr:adenine deaminase [Tindallia magadiensis]SFI02608.1 Adenine deaminase [Tindallia magadiensis]